MTVHQFRMQDLIRKAKEERKTESDLEKVTKTESLRLESLSEYEASVSSGVCEAVNVTGVRICNDFVPHKLLHPVTDSLASMEGAFVKLRGRSCLPLGGTVTSKGLVPRDDIPLWLSDIMDRVYSIFLVPQSLPRPNHALINAYEPGEGIMAHEDGPAYTPYATVLSLGSSAVFDFVSKSTDRKSMARMYLPIGSLLMFTDNAYKEVLHEYRSEKFDDLTGVYNLSNFDETRLGDSILRRADGVLVRGRRISITMRHVPLAA